MLTFKDLGLGPLGRRWSLPVTPGRHGLLSGHTLEVAKPSTLGS